MERDFEQPRPTLACHVARHFSQFGAIRLSPFLCSFLYPTPLPLPAQRAEFQPIAERISSSGKEKLAKICNENPDLNCDPNSRLFEVVCLLFQNDRDITYHQVKIFLGMRDSIAQFYRLAPLFTSRDTAADRLWLMVNVDAQATDQQLRSAGRLIVEGDPRWLRRRIVQEVGDFNAVACCYPFVPEDPPKDRLAIAKTMSHDHPSVLATASVFPCLRESSLLQRYGIIKLLARLNLATFPDHQRAVIQRVITECHPNSRLDFCARLASLSPEVLMQHLLLSPDELHAVLLLSTSSTQETNFLSKIEADVAKRELSTIQLALDSSLKCPALARWVYEMMHATRESAFLLANYLADYSDLESVGALIKALYEMVPEERAWLLSKLSPYLNHPRILDLIQLPHPERLRTLQRFDQLVSSQDTDLGGRFLFATICRLPPSEQDQACHYLRAFLRRDDDRSLREELFQRTHHSTTAAQVADAAAACYQELLSDPYLELDIHPIEIAPGKILPQLAPYLRNPIKRRMYIRRKGDPAADEGGPSREVLQGGVEEIGMEFRDCFAFDAGIATIAPLDPNLKYGQEILEKWRSLGRLFYLMGALGITLPEDLQMDPATFEAAATMSENLPHCLNLRVLMLSCGQNLLKLQQLFLQVFSYEIAKFGEEAFNISYGHLLEEGEQNGTHAEKREELVALISSRERLFQFTQGLMAMEGDDSIPCRAIMAHLLQDQPDLRSVLSNPERWDFSKLTDDCDCQTDFFSKWVLEAPLEQLRNLVFSMTGSHSLPPGRVLSVRNSTAVDGPFPHACVFAMDMPPILYPDALERFDANHSGALDSQAMEERARIESLLSLNLRDYATWAQLLNQLSLTNTNI